MPSFITNEIGEYSGSLNPGRYLPSADAEGFQRLGLPAIDLVDGEDRQIDFALAADVRPATVRGTVRDAAGAPLVGAQVDFDPAA